LTRSQSGANLFLETAMALKWIHENPATWDAGKARIVGRAPEGVFDARYAEAHEGDLIPGEWWRVEEEGRPIGYGWLDVNWGDAEISLCTDPELRSRGVGTYILHNLEAEAHARGLNHVYNVVRATHPDRERVAAWLDSRGFTRADDGRLMRAVLRKDRISRIPPPR
jgi:N-acetylglutamate synthase-like GNAT family acetyltransferase